ncbi:kinase-like domain-containing protein [Scenedesmus sp. NREL 46B-D3]|nr:kinase-like domain-containing protein [Scenedesmus sp. NREL 46B-D3]
MSAVVTSSEGCAVAPGFAGHQQLYSGGVLPGAVDYYITGPLQRRRSAAITKDDLKLGKRLGAGGFGSVYKATLTNEDGTTTPAIVKKAKEFGEAEVWMNERMTRASPSSCAEFLGGFLDTPEPGQKVGPAGAAVGLGGECVWLVWHDEGEFTLYDMMTKREFPYNVEPILLGRELRLPKNKRRRLVTLKLVMQQLLEALDTAHATGIVHRDVKPQNAILSVRDKRLKLIDWGAAADLRLGINYVPNEYLLDPRYAPPQQYVMSRQTATPPPKPVAALLSPVLWQMEHPDKFDMYSVGILFLQMVFPNLRSDNSLVAFNRRLQELGWDLPAWKREVIRKHPRGLPKEYEEGFEVLEAEEGAGWDLACQLVSYNPNDRPTAGEALLHRWLEQMPSVAGMATPSGTGSVLVTGSVAAATAVRSLSNSVGSTVGTVGRRVSEAIPAGLLEEAFTHSKQQGLTEAWLAEEFGWSKAAPPPPGTGPQRETIAWFMNRQSEQLRKLALRPAKFVGDVRRTIRGVARKLGTPGSPSSSRPGSPKVKGAAVANGNGKAFAAPVGPNGNGRGSPSVSAAAEANGDGRVSPAAAGGAVGKGKGLMNVLRLK